MKMTSSTSITSMYGTTLISDIGRLREPAPITATPVERAQSTRWRWRMVENSSTNVLKRLVSDSTSLR